MSIFRKHPIGSMVDLTIHLIPAVFSIFLFEIVAIETYLQTSLHKSIMSFFIWRAAQAVGGLFLGHLSDRFCRKKILIATQVMGLLILFLLWCQSFSFIALFFLGFLFNPSPVARAALVDNFPTKSKAQLIAITYIAQFVPWCFYIGISNLLFMPVVKTVFILLIINSVVSYLVFEDRRDRKKECGHLIHQPFLHSKDRSRAFYTLTALFPAQLVFFISDSFFESLASNAPLFSALGIGSLIGVIVGMFYRKIPHLSVLTCAFGIGILLSVVPLITNYLIPDLNVDIPYQLMLFSNLGGFYLPFVFDVILSATSVNYRGTACGIIEFIIAIASILGVGVLMIFELQELTILLLSVILFLVSTVIQKKGERHA